LPRSRSRRRRLRGVVDTSVLVAGISGFRRPVPDPDNASATLLRHWVDRRSFTWLVSSDILDEYREVLARLGVARATVGRVLNLLAEDAERISETISTGISPDPGDEPFCACAEAGDADFIVTLNPRDFPQARLRSRVIGPSDPLPSRGRPDRSRERDIARAPRRIR
jgi:predicted nucleic acid-binding protein